MLAYWRTYVDHRQLFGSVMPLDQIVTGIREFSAEALVANLAKIEVLLERTPFVESDRLQRFFARVFLSDADRARLVAEASHQQHEMPGSPMPWIFTTQQVWVAEKLALQFAPPTAARDLASPDARHHLGRLLLGIANHLELADVNNSEFEAAAATSVVPQLLQAMLRSYFLNAADHFQRDLVRFDTIVRQIAPRYSGDPRHFDVQGLIEEAVGTSYLTYIATIYAVNGRWYVHELRDLPRQSPKLDAASLFSDAALDRSEIDRVLAAISRDQAGFQAEPLARETEVQPYDFMAFRKSPLLRVGSNAYYPLGLKLLQQKITSGLLHTARSRLDNSAGQNFLNFVGVLFEDYGREVLGRIFPPPSGRLIREFYDSPDGQREAADALIDYGDAAVVVDFKVSSVTVAVHHAGDLAEFRRKANHAIGDGYRKCLRVIQDIRSGMLRIKFPDYNRFRTFYPLVVTLHTFPQDHLTNEEYARIAGIDPSMAARTPDLSFCTIADLEQMEELTYRGVALRTILEQKLAAHRDLPMGNMLFQEYPVLRTEGNRVMIQQLRTLESAIWHHLRSA